MSMISTGAVALLTLISAAVISIFTGGWIISWLGGVTKNDVQKQLSDFQSTYLGSVPSPLPSGAVLLIDDLNGCPKGWVDLGKNQAEHFADRMIMIAGKKKMSRERGGSESVKLNVSQLPPHSHKTLGKEKTIKVVTGGGLLSGEGIWISVLVPDDGRDSKERMTAAKSQSPQSSVELIPPYVALYFCKKI